MHQFKTLRQAWLSRKTRHVLTGAALCAMALAVPSAAQQPRYDDRATRCQDLERQLVSDWQRSNSPQEAVGRIDQQLDELQRKRRTAEVEADRRTCYEDMFLFGRSLRRTPNCIQLDNEIETVRRNITTLRQQRDAMTNSANRRMRREDLVAELARNGCGENYAREYESRRRSTSFFSLWEDEDSSFDRGYANTPPGGQPALPFASYRTMCVRMCDGFYFPISFSTLGSRFTEDESKCKSQCAAPAELYIYKNPGEEIEQMVSITGDPYNNLKNAWRHRKQYIKGCSCKQEEYSAHEIQLSEQELGKQARVAAPRSAPANSVDAAQPEETGSPAEGPPPRTAR